MRHVPSGQDVTVDFKKANLQDHCLAEKGIPLGRNFCDHTHATSFTIMLVGETEQSVCRFWQILNFKQH